MNRKDFIKKISIFTISIPFLTSCEVESGEKKEIIPGPYKIIGDLCVNCLKCFAVCPELDRDTIVQNINTVKINEAKCIECGECYSICPYDAIVKDERILDASEILHVDDEICTGCKICETYCPVNGILVLDGRASIAQELCVHCSKCLESCPLEAIRLGDKPIIEVNDPSLNYHVKSSWCTGCGDCISDCLENAISIVSGKAVIDTELCSQCGICKSTCSEEAIYQGDKIPFKYFVTSCKGCQRCVYPCPSDAIYMSNGKAIINQDKCTKCGECVNDCPWGLIKKI